MINKIKELFDYKFREETQDSFVKAINDFYNTHPEFTSRAKLAKYIGITPSRLTELTNKDKGYYVTRLKFRHIIPFWEKGVLRVQSLKLDTKIEEEKNVMDILDIEPTIYRLIREARENGATTEDLSRAITSATKGK